MVSRESIAEQFDGYGVETTDAVLDKCVELCSLYYIEDPVELVEQWLAFSLSNLNGAEPSVEFLMDMERKELANRKEKENSSASKKTRKFDSTTNILSEGNTLKVYGVKTQDPVNINDDPELDTLMGSYACQTPKAPKAAPRTPARHNDLLFTPVSYSPLCGTPKAHSEGSGKIVYTFGNPGLVRQATWRSTKSQKIILKPICECENNEFLNSKSKYMFDSLIDKSSILADRLFNIGKELCKKVFGEETIDYDLHYVDMPSQNTVKTVGRIACDFDGKLDPASTILIGADEMKCRTVRLNFSKTNSFGVFPGQIVMVSGMNPRGDTLYVEEIISERTLKLPSPPKLEQPISFVIAAGPYTNYDDLVYDPLHDLITYCKDNMPDVIILCGPFIEADHNLIVENVLAETFESFFEKMISGIVDAIGNETSIYIVSSSNDALSTMVYPTHPITMKKTFTNVHMLPNPCIINVNGVTLGITTIDIFDHILEEELAVKAGDKVKRVVNYLFQQGSFYPLNPPSINASIDSDLLSKFGKLETIPNVIILPSIQKYFIRDVHNCLAINPGILAGPKGGTFSRLVVHPSKEETNLVNYVTCQVMKV